MNGEYLFQVVCFKVSKKAERDTAQPAEPKCSIGEAFAQLVYTTAFAIPGPQGPWLAFVGHVFSRKVRFEPIDNAVAILTGSSQRSRHQIGHDQNRVCFSIHKDMNLNHASDSPMSGDLNNIAHLCGLAGFT